MVFRNEFHYVGNSSYWGADVLPMYLVQTYRVLFGRMLLRCLSVMLLISLIISLDTSHLTSPHLTVCSLARSDTHWALHQLYSQQTTGNPFIKRFSGFTGEHHSPTDSPSIPLSFLLTWSWAPLDIEEEEQLMSSFCTSSYTRVICGRVLYNN